MDEEDVLSNVCTDLVTLARLEPALVHLFGSKSAGEWVRVAELYGIAGHPDASIKAGLAAAWLPSPSGDRGAAVVLFYDDETLWSMTAWYDVARLFGARPVAATS
jgi:hypothetical protein